MSIEVMKQALEALEWNYGTDLENIENCTAWLDKLNATIPALRQAIEQAEKQEPAFYVIPATDRFGEGYEQTFWEDPAGFPVYTRPVYASDISQECVDETAKDRHEFEEMVKKGTKAWADTPDDWVDELRGGAEPVAFVSGYYGGQCVILPVYKDKLFSPGTALYTAPVYTRPVVHAVRCTYPQCQATNGCVGACSKTTPVHTIDMSEKHVHESDKDRHEWGLVTDDALIEEVRRRGFTIRDAQISPKIKDEYELCCQKYDTCTEPCTPRGRHLAKREWVGLTEQDVHDAFQFTELIKQLSFDRDRPEWCENFAAYLEAKLKEKNSG